MCYIALIKISLFLKISIFKYIKIHIHQGNKGLVLSRLSMYAQGVGGILTFYENEVNAWRPLFIVCSCTLENSTHKTGKLAKLWFLIAWTNLSDCVTVHMGATFKQSTEQMEVRWIAPVLPLCICWIYILNTWKGLLCADTCFAHNYMHQLFVQNCTLSNYISLFH